MKTIVCIVLLLMTGWPLFAKTDTTKWSASYEILEMSANKFQYFAGDIAYRLDDTKQFRLVIMEVKLSEKHLADDAWSKVVDGPNVTGYMRGYEINLDYFLSGGFYVMANIAYIHIDFKHLITQETYSDNTFSMGSGFGYKWNLPILNNRLFVNPSIPIRYFFNPIKETLLGGTTKVNATTIAPSVWLFIGYEF
jgi:hypothetical protein